MKKLYHYSPMVILSVIAILFAIAAQALALVNGVVLNPDIYIKSIDDNGVVPAIQNEYKTSFKALSNASGLPPEVFTDSITDEMVHESVCKLVKDSLEYMLDPAAPKPEIEFDFAPIEKNITDYIENDAAERDIEKSDEYYKVLNNTIKNAKDRITPGLDVSMMYTIAKSNVGASLHKYLHYINIAFWGCAVMAALIMVIMVIIDRRHPRDLPYWGGVIVFTSAAVYLIPCIYLKATDYLGTFFVKTAYVHRCITGVFSISLNTLLQREIILASIGIVLIISAQIIHIIYVKYLDKKYSKEHHHHHSHHHSESHENTEDSAKESKPIDLDIKFDT